MKTNTIIMTALFAATTAVPTFAASSALEMAVQNAANKATPVQAVQPYIATAAKDSPATAPNVLTTVLSQRASWTSQEVCGLYSAVLEGANLRSSFTKDLQNYLSGKDQQAAGVKLLAALNSACSKLPNGTFNEVLTLIVNDANGTARESAFQAANPTATNTNANICRTPQRDPRPNPVPVTPEPISPQN